MAKAPRSNKSSFGKRSDSEKSFRSDRKKNRSGRGEFDGGRSRSFSPRPSRFDKPEGERKSTIRRDDTERPKRTTGPFERRGGDFSSDRPKRFTGTGFNKREDGERKSFRRDSFAGEKPKRFGGDTNRDERPKRFDRSEGGSSFGRNKFDGEKPKRLSDSDERPKRFAKPDGEEKSFGRRKFDADRPKPFTRTDSGEEKPKRFSPSEEGEEKPFRKPRESSGGFERPRKFSREDIVKRKEGEPTERRSFIDSKKMDRRKPAPEYVEEPAGDGLIRLNKFIANSGVGSRREADELIKMGVITVNGVTITQLGSKVKLTDDVRHDGKRLKAEKPIYVLLNKPKGFITTTDDPQERNTVMNLVANAGSQRIYPVGRLDRNTTGLLLLTNDGDLTDKLTHPSYKAKKVYKAELDKPITKADFEKVQQGVHLEEGRAIVDDVAIVSDDKKTIGIELHIGWNRIVRRIFETLGYDVIKLDRVVYAGLDKKDLARGQWRFLRPEEVINLKHLNK
jgi:23S rRNA pseudouridine2605 synthase